MPPKSKSPKRSNKGSTGSERNVDGNGVAARLLDQLQVEKHLQGIHLNRRALDEMAFYPGHDVRKESPAYKKAHDHLTKELDLPCLVCGVKHSTLDKPALNKYGARAMETHHHVIEWALANAIDPDKFNSILLPNLAHRHPQNNDYKTAFTPQQVKDWVDHSEDNLWVLCDVHHRAKYFGIHEITYPIWCPMDMLLPNFEAYVKSQVPALAASSKKNTKNPPSKKAKKT